MIFERLHPSPGPVTAPELLAGVRARERAPADRPLVLLNMVATVDGRATVDGGSRGIGGAGDRRMFAELRAIADAVLIGSGTLRAEPYGRLVRDPGRRARRVAAGLTEDPTAVLLARTLDLPWDGPLFSVPSQPVVVACDAAAAERFAPPATEAPVTLLPLAEPTVSAALRELRAQRDVRTLLCEGGPTLNARLLAEGVLDELFLTLGPQLSGEAGAPGIVGGGGAGLGAPARLELRWAVRHADELLLRYAVTGCEGAQHEPGEHRGKHGNEQEGEIEEGEHRHS